MDFFKLVSERYSVYSVLFFSIHVIRPYFKGGAGCAHGVQQSAPAYVRFAERGGDRKIKWRNQIRVWRKHGNTFYVQGGGGVEKSFFAGIPYGRYRRFDCMHARNVAGVGAGYRLLLGWVFRPGKGARGVRYSRRRKDYCAVAFGVSRRRRQACARALCQ